MSMLPVAKQQCYHYLKHFEHTARPFHSVAKFIGNADYLFINRRVSDANY